MSKTTIPLHDAELIASMLVTELTPVCQRIAIAGSVRRRKSEVGDNEIVALPILEYRTTTDLFGTEHHDSTSMLEIKLDGLYQSGILTANTEHPRNGERYKCLIVHLPGAPTVQLDLFIADTINFGNVLAIRTGNAEFSRALVTQRRVGGLMPSNLKQRDGYLWRDDEVLRCPDEAAFFGWLELPASIDPATRNEATAQALARRIRVARAGMGER